MDYLYLLPLLWTITIVYGDNPSKRRDFTFLDLAKYDGYTAEEHFVITRDGYILRLFRIPPRGYCIENKGPIIFMHGLYLSGDDCIVPGSGKAHCYIYSDNCYDVWVPNVRGNFYSRNHTRYNPDKDKKFWDFTIDEMAINDLPAALDYVLYATDDKQLSFIGHSQGYTILLILCSKMPEYNDKIKIAIAMSATAWTYNAKFIVIQLQSLLSPALTLTGQALNQEIFPRNGLAHTAANGLCGVPNITYQLCSSLLFAAFGYDNYQITEDVLPVVMGHFPSGTSLKNFNRWGQIQRNGFTEYDYGSVKNRLIYGRKKSPLYDLTNVHVKTVLIASYNDNVGNLTDVQFLASKLSDVSLCVLSDRTFAHLDFVYGKDIPNYITPIVLTAIEAGSYDCT